MELTRDHRTIFVGQLTQKVRERDLETFFSTMGKLEHVLLIKDKFTNKSKGFAYVEYSNLEDIPKVLMMNGQVPPFQSFPIMIKASEAEKNFAARKDAAFSSGPATKASASGYTGGSAPSSSSTGTSSSAYGHSVRFTCDHPHRHVHHDHIRQRQRIQNASEYSSFDRIYVLS
jgi:RNA-binding protein 39